MTQNAKNTRGWLYAIAKCLGDLSAISNGSVGKRIGRRTAGKITGKGLKGLFK